MLKKLTRKENHVPERKAFSIFDWWKCAVFGGMECGSDPIIATEMVECAKLEY